MIIKRVLPVIIALAILSMALAAEKITLESKLTRGDIIIVYTAQIDAQRLDNVTGNISSPLQIGITFKPDLAPFTPTPNL